MRKQPAFLWLRGVKCRAVTDAVLPCTRFVALIKELCPNLGDTA